MENKRALYLCGFIGSMLLATSIFADNIDDAIARLKTGGEDQRKDAAEYLGSVGDERAVKALMDAMTDPEDDIREEAAEGLGKIGGADAVPLLIRALHDESIGVVRAAIKSLGRIGDDRAIDPLQEKAADTAVPWISQEASKSIMRIKQRSGR